MNPNAPTFAGPVSGSSPRRPRTRIGVGQIEKYAMYALAAICILNLNGVVNMSTRIGQSFSPIMLACCLVLLVRLLKRTRYPLAILAMLVLPTYAAFGAIYFNPLNVATNPVSLVAQYIASILIFSATVAYTSSLTAEERPKYLKFLRDILVIAGLSTLASPLLYQIYIDLPASMTQRMGGVFGNPNEAGIIGVIALAMIMVAPYKRKLFHLAVAVLLCGAVLLTFSKSAMAAMIVVIGLSFAGSARSFAIPALFGAVGLGFLIVEDFEPLVLAAVDMFGLQLDSHQLGRLLSVADILSGRIDAETTTHRTTLWDMILQDSLQRLPHGAGLGAGHFYLGGFEEGGVWMGAHNTFLMVLFEAGPIPLILLLLSIGLTAWRLMAFGRLGFALNVVLLVLLVEMMSSHTALTSRYSNICFATMLGVAAGILGERAAKKADRRRGAFSAPAGSLR